MRQKTIGNIQIEYPNELVYLGDNNIIKIYNNVSFSAKITIKAPNGETSTMEYTTQSKSIVFSINDNLQYIFEKTNDDWVIDITINNTTIFSFSIKVFSGKSFSTKSHCSSDVIYNYTGDDVEIFSPNAGKIVCGVNSVNVDKGCNTISFNDLGITQNGTYYLSLENRSNYQPIASILNDISISPTSSTIVFQTTEEGQITIDGGSLWEHKQIFPSVLKLHVDYKCDGDVILKYTNTDGVTRYVSGKLMEENDSFNPELSHSIAGYVYRYAPSFVNNSNSKILKIGVSDIESGAELNDIIYSDSLYILSVDNTWTQCVLKTDSIKNYRNNGYDEMMLDIIVNEL